MNQEEIMQQLQAAVQAYQGKNLDGSEAIFKQILAVNPKEPNALHLLGCIYKDRGQLQQAVELIYASIREDASNPIPFLNLGKILVIAGQHEKAAGLFQESLKRNQQIPETWFCFGNALREIEKSGEAKQAYRNTMQLNPAHAGAASSLGALLTDDGELEEAEQLFVKALEQAPNDVNLRINYGKLLGEKHEHAAAIVQYQIALPLAPQSAELRYNFANALKEEGEVEEAIASYRKAVEVKPDFVEAYLNLGIVLKEEGEVEEAIASYRKVIELKPDFANAYYFLAELEEKECLEHDAIIHYQRSLVLKQDFLILGDRSDASNGRSLTSGFAQKIKDALPPSYQFISSFRDGSALGSWASLWHVHIPKTGGMRIYNPLKLLLERIGYVGLSPSRNLFHVSRCHSPLELQAYSRALKEIDNALGGCIVNVFSVAQDPLWDDLCMRLQSKPTRVAFYRPAAQRLESALKYLYRTNGCDYSLLEKEINIGHLHLDNPTVRALAGVFDRGLSQEDLDAALAKDRVDYLLPLGDFSVGSKIQSAFLSANGLPNIILPSVINSTSSKYSPTPVIMEELLSLARVRGFDQWDQALDESLVLDDVQIGLPKDSSALNDWTLIFYSETTQASVDECVLMPTDELLSDQERWLPAKA